MLSAPALAELIPANYAPSSHAPVPEPQCSFSDFARPFEGSLHPHSPHFLLKMVAHLDFQRHLLKKILQLSPRCRFSPAASRAPGHMYFKNERPGPLISSNRDG